MHGLELLKKGIVWRICNGKNVRIWRDNWIPRGDFKITANVTKSRIRWVKDIIDHDKKEWKEDVVKKIFMPHDAEEVLKIRIPNLEQEDFVSWHFEKNGIFSVRSAYKLALNEKLAINTNSSRSTNGNRTLWSTVWTAKVPPKLKTFTWKLATESLAVQKNRSHRIPNQIPTCQLCGMKEEDGYHAVMECTTARALRYEMRHVWDLPTEEEMARSGEDWVLVLLDKLNEKSRAMVMFLWWRAW
jgi:hypothetical protein